MIKKSGELNEKQGDNKMSEKSKLSNGAIYRKTFCFSLRRLLLDLIALIILIAATVIGFYVTGQSLIGLGIGALAGIIIFALLVHFIGYMFGAAQIAMMTKGVTEDALPDNIFEAGKQEVKDNFATVAAYFAITKMISAIFGEITKGINTIGKVAGGGAAGDVADTISGIIQVVVSYLESCCLGWVFYKKGQNAFKSTCEGAVLFFKNWKALIKNLGRIFGLGALSLIVIGGALTVGAYNLLGMFPQFVTAVSKAVMEARPDLDLSDPTVALLVVSLLLGIVAWSILHAVFVKPFVLVGVLRNFMKAGIANPPKEEQFPEIEKISPKFKKAYAKSTM